MDRIKKILEPSFLLFLFILIIIFALHTKGFNPGTDYLGGDFKRIDWDYVDWNIHYWNMWEFRGLFTGEISPFFSTSQFYPAGISTITIHGDFFLKLIAGFANLLLHPDSTFLLMALFAFAGNALGGFILVRSLTGSRIAGLIAGILFCFNGAVAWSVNSGNVEYGIWFWICLYITCFMKMLKEPVYPVAVSTAIFGTAAILSNFVYAYHLAMLSLVIVIFNLRTFDRPKIRATFAVAVLTAILISPTGYMFILSHQHDEEQAKAAETDSAPPAISNDLNTRLRFISGMNCHFIKEYAPWFGRSSPLLKPEDIRNPLSLARKLNGKNPFFKNDILSMHLFNSLSDEARVIVSKSSYLTVSQEDLGEIISSELNRIMEIEYLYSSEHFAWVTPDSILQRPGIDISRNVESLQVDPPEGKELVLANRLLLELAYSSDLAPFSSRRDVEDSYTFYSFWILLFAALVFKPRESAPWILAFLLLFILSLGPYLKLKGIPLENSLPLPYILAYRFIPFYHRVFFPHRIFSFALITGGIAAGFGVKGIIKKFGKNRASAAGLILITAVLWECVTGWQVKHSPKPPVNGFYQTLAQSKEDFALIEIPFNSGPIDAKYLYYQTKHGKPLFNGVIPPYHAVEASPVSRSFEDNAWLRRIEILQGGLLADNNLLVDRISFPRPEIPGDSELYDRDIKEIASAGIKHVILHHQLVWGDNVRTVFQEEHELFDFLRNTLGDPVYMDEELEVFRLPEPDSSM